MVKGAPDFYRHIKLYAWDGTALREVKCDADGNLYIVIQGLYDTTLKTVKLDDQGRIIAMLKAMYGTTPKDVQTDEKGNIIIKSREFYAFGEMSPRLNVIFPSGRVLFQDAFEETLLKWAVSGDTGYSVERVTDNPPPYGGACAKILAPTGGSAKMEYRIGLPYAAKMGIDCFFTHDANCDAIDFWLAAQRVGIHHAAVRYDADNNKWQYMDSTGAWADVTDGSQDLYEDPTCFHHMKLTADFDLKEYIALKCDHAEWDLRGIRYYWAPAIGPVYSYMRVELTATTAGSSTSYIDEVIITEEG